jgi:hypothetical protein
MLPVCDLPIPTPSETPMHDLHSFSTIYFAGKEVSDLKFRVTIDGSSVV